MSTLEDAIKIADRQQFRTGGSNARFRDEFIRKSLQNPGNFYRTYGTDLKAMDSGQVTTTQPMEQTPSLPSTQTVPSSSTDFNLTSGDISRGDGGGYSYGASPSSGQGIGSGGLLGNNPHTGSALGTLAGVFGGGPLSGIAGQALSGTPQSMEAAAKSAALGYGVSELGRSLNASPLGMSALGLAAQSVARGRAPSMEELGLTALYQTPLAPLAAIYGIGKSINRGMAEDHANQGKYGLATQNTWGPPTIGTTVSGWFGGPTNEMKGEDGTGLMASPSNYGFASGVPGVNFGPAAPGMGLGRGLTPSQAAQLGWANTIMGTGPQATSLEDLYGALYGVDPATETWGGTNTWGGWGVGGDSGDSGVGGATDDGQGTGGGFGVGSVGGSGEGEASDGLGY